jgi:signal transduction histidine kinase/CheY-like chemotaxis protein
MTTEPPGDTLLRRLLALESQLDPAFAEGVRALCGADALVLLTPTADGNHRVAPGSALPADVRQAARGVTVDPGSHPLLFSLSGMFHLQVGDLRAVPLSRFFPEASWCLVGVGESWSFGALWYGSGTPPEPVVADALLAGQLLRLIGGRVGVAGAGPWAASAALACLSHEFKTPLVSIKGYAELILDQDDGTLDPRTRQWVARIAGGANRLAALFRKATAEARTVEADSYEARPVEPAEWVRRCVEETTSLAAGRRLEWQWHAAGELPCVGLDPEAGRDLLLELLQNAARATPDGGHIVVEVAAAQRNLRPGVEVSVQDSGVGFPAGPGGEHLFERFTSLSPGFAHHSGEFEYGAAGLGRGLAMARGVARAHGGEVWAEGRGRDDRTLPGTVFRVWLPRAEPGPGEGQEGGAHGRVLLLEPDPEPRQILATALGESYEVVCVASAAEARQVWKEGEWVACVLEPRVPGGGVALVQELRDRPEGRDAAILAYTTAAAASETAAWRAAGADSCIGKPARARVLLQRLRTVRNRRTRR